MTITLVNGTMLVKIPSTLFRGNSPRLGEYEVEVTMAGAAFTAGQHVIIAYPNVFPTNSKLAAKESDVLAVVAA